MRTLGCLACFSISYALTSAELHVCDASLFIFREVDQLLLCPAPLEARVFHSMQGEMTVDTKQARLAAIKLEHRESRWRSHPIRRSEYLLLFDAALERNSACSSLLLPFDNFASLRDLPSFL